MGTHTVCVPIFQKPLVKNPNGEHSLHQIVYYLTGGLSFE